MSGYEEDGSSQEDFRSVWDNAVRQYGEDTKNDVTMFRGWGLDQISQHITKNAESFKKSRDGSESTHRVRDVLKACVAPVEALSSVASSAASLTPFAPAATVFGAGMYLIKACDQISEALDTVSKIFEHCRDFVDRLYSYFKNKATRRFITKITRTIGFMLDAFADCEKQLMEGKKIHRFRTWLKEVFLGKRPDQILKAAHDRLEDSFKGEERAAIADIYTLTQETAVSVAKLIAQGQWAKRQRVIESLPRGPHNVLAKQAQENNKSHASPPAWVLEDESFLRWWNETADKPTWLWGLGSTGAGKTSIVSYLTNRWLVSSRLPRSLDAASNHHSDGPASRSRHTAVALFYGDYKIEDEQRPDLIFQSLIRQLLLQLKSTGSPEVDRLYERVAELNGIDSSSRSEFSQLSWTMILNDLLGLFDRAFVVIDALDDLDDGYADLIRELSSLTSPSLRLFVTSRDLRSLSMEAEIQNAIIMHISAKDDCLERYVRGRLSNVLIRTDAADGSGNSAKVAALLDILGDGQGIEEVVDRILVNSMNDFYRAEFQVTSLKGIRSREDVDERLDAARTEILGDAIKLNIQMIKSQKDHYKRKLGLQALLLATHAERTLTVAEMQHAVVLLVHPRTREDASAHLRAVGQTTKELILESSCGILEVDEELGRFKVDEIIKAYCKTADVFKSAHYDLATICLTYLDNRCFSLRADSKEQYQHRRVQYPFYGYAGRYWGKHLQEAGEKQFLEVSSPVSLATLLRRKLFLNIAATALHEDLQPLRMWSWGNRDSWADLSGEQPILWPLHLLAYFDLRHLTDWWLQHHADDVNRAATSGTIPLFLACAKSRTRIVETLLFDHHADPGLKGSPPSGFCLAAAIRHQSAEVVERLLYLRRKDLLEQTNVHEQRPLGEALRSGNLEIAKLLVDASVALDRNGSIKYGGRGDWTALHEAATVANSSASIQYLVGAPDGKDLLRRQTRYWRDTPLHLAAVGGHDKVVDTLLGLGADPHARQSLGKTPLMLAVEGLFSNNEKVIRKLLSWSKAHNVADHDLVDNQGDTIWHLAAKAGRNNTLNLLTALTPRSLFNVKNKANLTPIRVAADVLREREDGGHVHCIYVLLRNQPDLISPEDAQAVLEVLLTVKDYSGICKQATGYLLGHQIEVSPFMPGSTTIIHCVVANGTVAALEVAWETRGFRQVLEYRDAGNSTPLLLAAKMERHEMALFLLRQGADPAAQDSSGRTALHYAVEKEMTDLARHLYAEDFDHGARDKDGVAALDRMSAHNTCTKVLPAGLPKSSSAETMEHECVSCRRSTALHVASGSIMRDKLLKEGVLPHAIGDKHCEFLRSDPIPPATALPVSRLEVSVTWSVFENNDKDDAVVTVGTARGGKVHEKCPMFIAREQADRGRAGLTRTAVWHLEDGIINELQPTATADDVQGAKKFVRSLAIGDELFVAVEARGHGRIASITEASIRVYYER